jgi:uncharacterized protein (TIGR00297 family)
VGEWRKVIPESRDRLQSRVLVWCVAPMLAIPCLFCLGLAIAMRGGNFPLWMFEVWGISLTFGVVVWALRAATPMAAVCGTMICLLVTLGTGHGDRSPFLSGLAPLATLFLLTFAATKAGRIRKARLGLAEGRRGRNAAQIIANLGAAGLVVVACVLWALRGLYLEPEVNFPVYVMPILLLAALCEATADTVSSEIGQAFGGRPIMLTTMRRVETGTDGAVSLLGTAAGILAASVVAAVGMLLMGMWAGTMSWRQAMVGFAGGVAGLFFDSVLGATVERKGWLGNDLVNFSSTVFAVGVALGLAVVLRPR